MARIIAAACLTIVWIVPISVRSQTPAPDTLVDWESWGRDTIAAVRPPTAEECAGQREQTIAQLEALSFELDKLPEGADLRSAMQWDLLKATIAADDPPLDDLRRCYVALRRVRAPAVQQHIDQLRGSVDRLRGQSLLRHTPDWQTELQQHVGLLVRCLPIEAAQRSSEDQQAVQAAYAWLASTHRCRSQLDTARAHLSFPNQWLRVSGAFLESMSQHQLEHPFTVSESMEGTVVEGQGVIRVFPNIRLQPDEARGTLRVQINGEGEVPITAVSRPATVQAVTRVSFSADQLVSITPDGVQLPPAAVNTDSQTSLQGIALHMRSCLARRMLRPLAERMAQRKLAEGDEQARQKARQQIQAGLSEGSVLLGAQVNDLLQRFFWQSLTTRDIEARARVRSTPTVLTWSADYSSPTQLGAPTAAVEPPVPWDILFQFHESSINNTNAAIAGMRIDEITFREVFFELFRFQNPDAAIPAARIPAAMWLANDDPLRLQIGNDAIVLQLRLQAIECNGQRTPADITVHARYALERTNEGLALRRLEDLVVEAPEGAVDRDQLNEALSRFFLPLIRTPTQFAPHRGAAVSVAYVNLDRGWLTLALTRSTAATTLSSVTKQP